MPSSIHDNMAEARIAAGTVPAGVSANEWRGYDQFDGFHKNELAMRSRFGDTMTIMLSRLSPVSGACADYRHPAG
jgi:hypothetical protein